MFARLHKVHIFRNKTIHLVHYNQVPQLKVLTHQDNDMLQK